MPASPIDERVSKENRVPAPLMHLIADVLATSFSYEMSEEFADLLEHDVHLLAAMQRLVFLVLKQQQSNDL
jgi:hypothetical protein